MADAGADTFEAAIKDAKAEGNLSRANVVRKVKGERMAGGRLTVRDTRSLIDTDGRWA
jgi:hypothetical protein